MALLAPILVFGLVIFVHELGHFIAAKALGVYAPRFSIGFGPSIFRRRRGETEYVLAWLPLGGYVRMASRHDAETAFMEGGSEEANAKQPTDPDYDPDAMMPFGPKPVPEDRWFESKSLLARVIILVAGVAMNTLLAILVNTGVFLSIGQDTVKSTVVGAVAKVDAAPALADLHQGDTILSVNGTAVSTWNDVQRNIVASSNQVRFTTQHGDVTVPLKPDSLTVVDVAEAVTYFLPAVVDSVVAGTPAAVAGLQRGDSIVSVNGSPVTAWPDMTRQVTASSGVPLALVVARAGALDTVTVTPQMATDTNPETGKTETVGRIGVVRRSPVDHESLGAGRALAFGWRRTMQQGGAVFKVIHDIGAGTQSMRQLGGPIAITRASVEAAQGGLEMLFSLIALLSINVAVMNLLPVPILDGGQILINVLESVKGSPFSLRTREYILRVGLLAIGALFVLVMYNDTRGFFAWIGRHFT